jgi:hypothetical protein
MSSSKLQNSDSKQQTIFLDKFFDRNNSEHKLRHDSFIKEQDSRFQNLEQFKLKPYENMSATK